MAWIDTIPPDKAEGELAKLYRRVGNPDGTVDNVMTVHSLNVDSLRTHFEMYTRAMHKESPLSRAEREMVAVVVSRLNGCDYCVHHHHAGLVRLLPVERYHTADQLRTGERHPSLTAREAAMLAWAEQLTVAPEAMDEAALSALREEGLDDRAVLDLAQCVGYFNYVNRIVLGLGVQLGEGEGDAGQWPDEAPAEAAPRASTKQGNPPPATARKSLQGNDRHYTADELDADDDDESGDEYE